MKIESLVLLLSVVGVWGQATDLTCVEHASGAAVVFAVNAKMDALVDDAEFVDQAMFDVFREIAFVETRDGTVPYSNGGIWNISQSHFVQAQSDRTVTIGLLGMIDVCGKAWVDTTFDDTLKPFVSGLAVRAYFYYLRFLDDDSIFRQLTNARARFWANSYNPGRNEIEYVNAAQMIPEECTVSTDLIFVLDASGSIGRENFTRVRDFVSNYTSDLLSDDGISNIRVGVISFSFFAYLEFGLAQYSTRMEVLAAIGNIPYTHGGTNTADALRLLRGQFNSTEEAGILRIAVVLTDGMSNDFSATVIEAQNFHNMTPPVLVYAVGVGSNTNETELMHIASGQQFITNLDLFSQLPDFEGAIEYEVCFTASTPIDIGTGAEAVLNSGETARYQFNVDLEGITIRLCVINGRIALYASPTPGANEALHTFKFVLSSMDGLRCQDVNVVDSQLAPNVNGKRQVNMDSTSSLALYVTIEGLTANSSFAINTTFGNTAIYTPCSRFPCHINAQCTDTLGSYECTCLEGFEGDGFQQCTDTSKRQAKFIIIVAASTVGGVLLLTVVIAAVIKTLYVTVVRQPKCKKDDVK